MGKLMGACVDIKEKFIPILLHKKIQGNVITFSKKSSDLKTTLQISGLAALI